MSRMVFGGNIGDGKGVDDQYVILPLPYTEAEATDDIHVCECNSPTANSNETGVGGGVLGADLVHVQSGSIPAAVNGGRTITAGTAKYFGHTQNFIRNFVENAAGFSLMWRCRNIHGSGWIYRMLDPAGSHYIDVTYDSQTLRSYGSHVISSGLNYGAGIAASGGIQEGDDITIIASWDYVKGLGFYGVGASLVPPTRFIDFSVFQLMPFTPLSELPQSSGTMDALELIGAGSPRTACGFDAMSITAAKYPCVTPI